MTSVYVDYRHGSLSLRSLGEDGRPEEALAIQHSSRRVIPGLDPGPHNYATANTWSNALKLQTICYLNRRDPRVNHEDDNAGIAN